jgi:hypothetical protein
VWGGGSLSRLKSHLEAQRAQGVRGVVEVRLPEHVDGHHGPAVGQRQLAESLARLERGGVVEGAGQGRRGVRERAARGVERAAVELREANRHEAFVLALRAWVRAWVRGCVRESVSE